MNGLGQDVRYALRSLWRNSGFTVAAVGCLALGIGANTAIFSVMNAVMIQKLAVREPGRLIQLGWRSPGRAAREVMRSSSGYGSQGLNLSLSYPAFEHLRAHSRTLAGVAGFVPIGFQPSLAVRIGQETSVAAGEMVSGNYFSVLGVSARAGRLLTEADERPGAPHAAVLSYGYWQSRFGADAAVVGRKIAINRAPYTVVGVAPREFFGLNASLAPDIWLPLREERSVGPWGARVDPEKSMFRDKRWWWLMIVGRLRPGITMEAARAEVAGLFHQNLVEGLPTEPENLPELALLPASRGMESLRERLSRPLWILMGAVALVLLIACANVAILLVARAAGRQKEIGVRLAVGASRRQVVRQLLVESVVLSGCGGLLGLLLAGWGSQGLMLLMSRRGQTAPLEVAPDGWALAFTLGLSLATGIGFGLWPAYRATRADVARRLKQGSATLGSRLAGGRAMVACQAALSLLLLTGAGLMLRTLHSLVNEDLGFNASNLLVFALDPVGQGYERERAAALYEKTLAELRGVPGVQSVSASSLALLTGWVNSGDVTVDRALPPEGDSNLQYNHVGPGFLETMQMTLLLGRGIDERDFAARRRVAVVNEAMARHFYSAGNPVGRRFRLGRETEDWEIVGLVKNAKFGQLRDAAKPAAYLSAGVSAPPRLHFELRTSGDPMAALPAVRDRIRRLDANLPLLEVGTQEQLARDRMQSERMFAGLASFFALLALALVALGLYGTLAYSVSRRFREIGIRMALGAQRGAVARMVGREGLVMIAAGTAVGIPAAMAASRVLAGQLYGVAPGDARTMVAAVAVLFLAGFLAAFLPARRAGRVNPLTALRHE